MTHDCARTSRTYLLGISSCHVCGVSVWAGIWNKIIWLIRGTLNGDIAGARRYAKATGMRRVFTWRDGFEWTHGDPRRFKKARREWRRER
jgi:hypothetical protein